MGGQKETAALGGRLPRPESRGVRASGVFVARGLALHLLDHGADETRLGGQPQRVARLLGLGELKHGVDVLPLPPVLLGEIDLVLDQVLDETPYLGVVEVDLLLGGHRLPMRGPLPAGDCYALVSRSGL